MDYYNLYGQFSNELWNHFMGSEQSKNRKSVTFAQWIKRSQVARRAMSNYLIEHGAPKENPFFWVQRFPEPVPTDYNGKNMPDGQEMYIALYNGKAGIYSRQDVEDYEMQIKKRFEI